MTYPKAMTDRIGKKSSMKYTDSNIDPALYIDSLIIFSSRLYLQAHLFKYARPMP
jgi:hypothetical protein